MARILLTSQPALAHLHLAFPIARAATEEGDDVRFASSATVEPVVGAADISFLPAGTAWKGGAVDRVLPGFYDLPPELQPVTYVRDICATRLAPPFLDDLLAAVKGWQPDVVVSDPTEFAGPALAAILEVPHVALLFGGGAFTLSALASMVAEPFGNLCETYGVSADPIDLLADPPLCLHLVPRQLLSQEPEAVHARTRVVRPEIFDATMNTDLPSWVSELPNRPTVYATLGTVWGTIDRFRHLVDAVHGLDANVIITTGTDIDPAELGSQPEGVYLERYIPNGALLPHVDVLLTHGGYASIVTALSAGIPMVLTPIGADQPENARRCEEIGVGLTARLDEPESVRAALEKTMSDGKFKERARAVARGIASQPDSSEAAAMVRALAAKPS
ncbi:MAG: nucleotide disphospho-sugar-binding domain-containing protein [Gemmatimonadota bacterium]